MTKVATAPLTRTPRARNGSACTKIPQNTVAAVAISALPATNSRAVVPIRANPMMVATRIGIEPMRLVACVPAVTAVILPAMR